MPSDDRKLRSGYTEVVAPDRLKSEDQDATRLPIASDSGRQTGVPPPATRVLKPAYDMVSVEEAADRLRKRREGKLPPIRGGLDDKSLEEEEPGNSSGAESPPSPAPAAFQEETPGVSQALDDADAREVSAFDPSAKSAAVKEPPQLAAKKPDNNTSLAFQTAGGTYIIPVHKVVAADYGVAVFIAKQGNNAIFIPTVGTEFGIQYDGKSYGCLYPGTYFELPEEHLLLMVFLTRKGDSNGQKTEKKE